MRTLLAALAALSCALPAAAKPKPCTGTFDLPHALLAGAASTPGDQLLVEGRRVSLLSGCRPRRATVKVSGGATKIAVTWPRCGSVRRVHLKVTIAAGCDTVSGT